MSLGVQAFDDQVLSFLGRGHSAKEAIDAIEIAAAHFGRYSFDLIYARPGQTLSAWHQELDRALALAGSHLSLYQLTVERGTPFYGLWRQGRLAPLDDDEAAGMFDNASTPFGCRCTSLRNFEPRRPRRRMQAQSTLLALREYAGIGPGAHARLEKGSEKFAVERRKLPERWLQMVEQEGHGTRHAEALDCDERLAELVLMGLPDPRWYSARTLSL